MNKFVAFMRDESGASAAEYVLILAVIGGAIAGASLAFGQAISQALVDAKGVITGIDFTPTPAPAAP